MLVCKYVEENGSAATKRSAGVTLEVNLKEHTSHMPPPSENEAATLVLKPRGDATRSP